MNEIYFITEIVFWIVSATFSHVYITYPMSLYFLGKVKNIPVKTGNFQPSVTLIVPAHNEESVIDSKIKNCLLLDYPSELLQIIVVSDGSTDRTNEIIFNYQDKLIAIIIEKNQGKTNAINQAMKQAAGEFTIFSDANVDLASDSIKELLLHFHDPSVGCVCGQLSYTNSSDSETSSSSNLYWRYEEFIKEQESKTGSVMGADGSIFGIRSKLFIPLHKDLIDDFATSMSILANGHRVSFQKNAKAYEKSATNIGEESRRRRRIANRLYTTYSKMKRDLRNLKWGDRYRFTFHRLLRWHTTLMMIVIFVANAILYQSSRFYEIMLSGQLIFYFLALVGIILNKRIRLPKIIYVPYFFMMMNLNHSLGILDFIRGVRQTTWVSPKTTRER